MTRKKIAVCAFCGLDQNEVDKMFTHENAVNDDVYICKNCLMLCPESIGLDIRDFLKYDDQSKRKKTKQILDFNPRNIKKYLDEYVIGQEFAKMTLSVALYNHHKRLKAVNDRNVETIPTKGNILMIGPTGCGKTLIVKSLAELLDVPFVMADATTLTQAGYVGEDVEQIIKNLWLAADRDIEKTQQGIVCIDEVDKIATRSGGNTGRDVGGEGVQQALLKVIESGSVALASDPKRSRPNEKIIHIDTTNILFIFTGAFTGITDIINHRTRSSAMGFNAKLSTNANDESNLLKKIETDDLIKYGLIPEFMGRIPVIVPLQELDKDALLEILSKPQNAILKQYELLFSFEDVKLTVTHPAKLEIVEQAIKLKSGARGLRSVLEELMLDIMFELPSMTDVEEVIIDKKTVTQKTQPTLKKRQAS